MSKRKSKSAMRRVALVMEPGQALTHSVSRGIFRFLLHRRPDWRLDMDGFHPFIRWDRLNDWRGDGVISMVQTGEHREALRRLKVPVVRTSSRFTDRDLPSVFTDNEAVGRMAGEHLIACRLKHFVCAAEFLWDNEQLRRTGFVDALAAAGLDCVDLKIEVKPRSGRGRSVHRDPNIGAISKALLQAPKPVGVFAANPFIGPVLLEACREAELAIPEQVAVVVANYDPMICDLVYPPLSGIIHPKDAAGFQAAAMLDEMLQGRSPEPRNRLLPPIGVASQLSTDVLTANDMDVAAALRFMREHAEDEIRVSHVVDFVQVSRRSLELKFRACLGHTPAVELRRMRIERAKRMLIETDLPVLKVALLAGFNSRQVFSTIFREEAGVTPTDYRNEFRGDPDAPGPQR